MPSRMSRREALKGWGVGMLAVAIPGWRIQVLDAQGKVQEININSSYPRGQWFYEPVGLYIQKGQKVRWVPGKWGTTVTAFHPSNSNHELRIPKDAKPFDSGLIGEDSPKFNLFEWTFDVEGTYDYYSRNHEPLGLVGRIVVGTPGGPAEDNAPGYGAQEGRAPVFPAQAAVLRAITSADIVSKKAVPFPRDLNVRRFPYSPT